MAKQDKRKTRIDTSGETSPLTDNPFAGLDGIKTDLPTGPEREESAVEEEALAAGPRVHVTRTRKGGFPVFLEKRPGGKNVTVIRNISGDAEALLRTLRKRLGAGGAIREDAIEIQGDHRDKVIEILRAGL